MNIGVILLAGGSSARMGGSIPKTFLTLKGRPVILYSFDLFTNFPHVVVAPDNYHHIFPKNTIFAKPGPRRQDSVQNGLTTLGSHFDFILIHDGARPLIKKEDILKLLRIGQNHPGAALASPVTNTLRKVSQSTEIVDRTHLWEVYTPQLIRTDLLKKGLAQNITVTDDLALIEALGYTPILIPSSFPNIKLTYPSDIPLIEALL